MKSRLEMAIKASVDAGDVLMENYGKIYQTRNKESLRDVVSEIDKLSEEKVITSLKENDPDCSLLTEESGMIGEKKDSKWIIDALDGTVNYIHNIPFFCVSVSYWQNNAPKIGVIYNPYSKEIFYAEEGLGSFVNQTKIQVEKKNLKQGLSAMAFSGKAHNPKKRESEFVLFGQLNDSTQGCLRTGSAAMNLAYLSSGKFNIVLGKANKLWDVAAGMLIAKEAGANLDYKIIDQEKSLVDYICYSSSTEEVYSGDIDLSYLQVKQSL